MNSFENLLKAFTFTSKSFQNRSKVVSSYKHNAKDFLKKIIKLGNGKKEERMGKMKLSKNRVDIQNVYLQALQS